MGGSDHPPSGEHRRLSRLSRDLGGAQARVYEIAPETLEKALDGAIESGDPAFFLGILKSQQDHQELHNTLGLRNEDAALRRSLATRIVILFAITNIVVLGLLAAVFFAELLFYVLVYGGDPTDRAKAFEHVQWANRSVNSTVIGAVIAATVAQLGVVMVVIIRYIFPASDGRSPIMPRKENGGSEDPPSDNPPIITV